MEQQKQQKPFTSLLLASSILIAGLFIGGSILSRNGSLIDPVGVDSYSRTSPVAQPKVVGTPAPSCGF